MVPDLQFMKMRTFGKNLPGHASSRGKQVVGKYSRREEEDDVVLIDVDSDIPDIIIIDVPESVQKKLRKPSPRTVINIDDDDDDDDEVADGVCNNDNDSASPSSSRSSAKAMGSKCKQTSPRNGGSRNRYGLESESESVTNESDCSDCECMEGPSGELRYQWELASKRRKTAFHTDVYTNNQASTSASNPDRNSVRGKENAAPQAQSSNHCSPAHMRNGEENNQGSTFGFPECAFGNNSTRCAAEKPQYVDVDPHFSSFCENQHGAQEPMIATNGNEWDTCLNYPVNNVCKRSRFTDEPCLDHRQPSSSQAPGCDIAEPLNEDPALLKPHHVDSTDFECDRVASVDADEEFPTAGVCGTRFGGTTNSNGEEKSAAGLASFSNFTSTKKVDVAKENTTNCRESVAVSLQNNQKPETNYGDCPSVQMEAVESTSYQLNTVMINKITDVVQDVGGKSCQNDMLTDRQKIKETDVYKRAMEEEWAARQQQLQIQAEEAQKLRKRKKVQSMRIMDVERRQRQRVEEIRETQKKDEENINMKERLLVEIRKELTLLEESCRDMASLLRRLGIHVGDHLFPSQNEVQAAYKKALLKFHPDRASRTDMRQQVEAEEKFKLICRMKEKFSLGR